MVRVLIVDDSAVAAEALTGILESDPEIRVIAVARNGLDAIKLAPVLKPDLITMDVWMPQMDGFATVEQIMAYHPTPILVVTASLARGDVDISLTMLAAGALDVMEKPSRLSEAAWARAGRELIRKVKLLSRVQVVTHLKGRRGVRPPAPPPTDGNGATAPAPPPVRTTLPARPVVGAAPPASTPATPRRRGSTDPLGRRRGSGPLYGRRGTTGPLVLPPHPPPQPGVNRFSILTIASSTGGPQALLVLLRSLPPAFPLPIVIVQHIAAGFTQGMADWLGRETGRPVALAAEGQQLLPGAVLLAPDGVHMAVTAGGRIHLDEGPPTEIRPAADVLLRSVAAGYGPRAIGVILTGMGRDGADGLKAMRLAGAVTLAQDEATSIIFGMPRAAIALGVIDTVLPLDAIAPHLEKLVAGQI